MGYLFDISCSFPMKHQQSHPLFIFNTPILCVFIPETQIFKTLYLHVCHQIQIPSNPFCSWFPIQSPFKSTYFQNPADNGHPGGLLAEVEAIEASAVLGDVYPHDAYTSRLRGSNWALVSTGERTNLWEISWQSRENCD